MTTTVVNLHHRPKPAFDIYVGREGRGQTGYFGNPHTLGIVGRCGTCFRKYGLTKKHPPEEVLTLFEQETLQRIIDDAEFAEGLLKLRGKVLACFCVKRDGTGTCHALYYARWLDSLPDGATVERLVAYARAELARLAALAVEEADTHG